VIDQMETEIQSMHHELAQPEFYKQPGPRIAEKQARLKLLEDQLTTAYTRWEELSNSQTN